MLIALVRVDAARREGQLVIEIVNSAAGGSPDHEGFGVGLANVIARLERLYAADYSLDLDLEVVDGDELMRLRLALPIDEGRGDARG